MKRVLGGCARRRPHRRRCDLAVPPAQPNSECLAAHSIVWTLPHAGGRVCRRLGHGWALGQRAAESTKGTAHTILLFFLHLLLFFFMSLLLLIRQPPLFAYNSSIHHPSFTIHYHIYHLSLNLSFVTICHLLSITTIYHHPSFFISLWSPPIIYHTLSYIIYHPSSVIYHYLSLEKALYEMKDEDVTGPLHTSYSFIVQPPPFFVVFPLFFFMILLIFFFRLHAPLLLPSTSSSNPLYSQVFVFHLPSLLFLSRSFFLLIYSYFLLFLAPFIPCRLMVLVNTVFANSVGSRQALAEHSIVGRE